MHYVYVRVFAHNPHMCKQMAAQDGSTGVWRGELEGCPTTYIASPFRESAFRQRAGWPRKYEGSWFSANKRIYLAELTLEKLRAIKSSYRLGSDDAAVQHLIARHEYLCAMER